MMKYLLYLYVFVLFCIPTQSIANENIEFGASREELTLGEEFTLDVAINAQEISDEGLEFSIPGIENFNIFSQSRSENYSNINGQINRNILFNITLTPREIGELELGPITIQSASEEIIDDEIITVRVLETNNFSEDISEDQTINDLSNTEDNQTIRGLRSPLYAYIGFGIAIAIFLISFLILLFISIRYLLNQKQKIIDDTESREISKDAEYITFFKKLGKESESMQQQEFFKIFNTKLKEILENNGLKNASSKTLEEIQVLANRSHGAIVELLTQSYEPEYKNIHEAQPEKYIDTIITILSKRDGNI